MEGNGEFACKPGSVVDSHSSRIHVTMNLKRPTRIQRGPRLWIPIWSCSERGLPSPRLLPAARPTVSHLISDSVVTDTLIFGPNHDFVPKFVPKFVPRNQHKEPPQAALRVRTRRDWKAVRGVW